MWYMKNVTVTTEVPVAREEVYDFLDVMANHEPFTNHMLFDWSYSGPPRGVGSKASVKAKAAGVTDEVEIEVVAADPPRSIVEENVGAKGGRRANGTYTLEELPAGGTRITFDYSWKRATPIERLLAPLVRATLRRGNRRAMERLGEQLARRTGEQDASERPADLTA
jgi:hypothetical protein